MLESATLSLSIVKEAYRTYLPLIASRAAP